MNSNKILIACDIDGTILNSDHGLDALTLRVFEQLRDNPAVIVCLITGRSWVNTKAVYDQLKLNTVAVCCNGCEIVNDTDHRFLPRYFCFHKNAMRQIMISPVFEQELIWSQVIGIDTIYRIDSLANLHDFLERDYPLCHQEIIYFRTKLKNKQSINRLFGCIKTVAPHLLIQCWEYPDQDCYFIELGASYGTKRFGVEFLINYYDVRPEDVYVFGDNINDITMLQLPCHTYAMANAVTQAKLAAKNITAADNNNNGVAHELQRIFGLT